MCVEEKAHGSWNVPYSYTFPIKNIFCFNSGNSLPWYRSIELWNIWIHRSILYFIFRRYWILNFCSIFIWLKIPEFPLCSDGVFLMFRELKWSISGLNLYEKYINTFPVKPLPVKSLYIYISNFSHMVVQPMAAFNTSSLIM